MDNPHNINIHTQNINESEVDNPLKYLCLSYEKYGLTSMPTVTEYACINGSHGVLTDNIKKNISDYKISKLGVGSQVASIIINGKEIGAFVGNDGEIIYLSKSTGLILKPNDEVYDEFFDSLDNFQKILLNKDTNYTATFEVISENSFGYITEMKSFTFPTTFGDNNEKYKNLAVNNAAYNSYLNDLMKYAKFYDEYFSDNIWRSMTHEAIKNFDWTYTREYGVGEEEGYVFGGTRMQKTLRLIGREFDEIKTYIDALKNYQKVDYGKGNAIPDYFLTDAVNLEGWDVENIYPYDNNFKQVQKLNGVTIKPYSSTYVCNDQKNGYFYKCENCNKSKPTLIPATGTNANKNELYDGCFNGIRPKIKQYISENEYSISDINNHFMKMLKLNSKNIFRKKGTIQGIESLLAMFGLRSKRWCYEHKKKYNQYKGNCFTEYKPDYDIKEYVAVVNNSIQDRWLTDGRNMNEIDWYNSTKTISYDTEDYRNGIYYSYQGLPVRAYVNENGKLYNIDRLPVDINGNQIEIDGKVKYLYPYFSPYKLIDGNPYYQMNGGWLNRKPKIFDKDNNRIEGNIRLDKETYRNIRTVKTLRDMINIPRPSLKDNDLCYVEYVGGEYVLIDGILYDIQTDEKGKYISTYIINNTAKVGSKMFASELTVSTTNGLMKYVFSEYKQNTEIRIYIYNNTMTVYGKYYAVNNVSFILNGHYSSIYEEGKSLSDIQYYQLKHLNNKAEIGGQGWNQVLKDDALYKRLNSIVDKFKGNNPHTGHMNYDNGKEYLTYFSQLFKHALEDNQFNERCYSNRDYFKEVETIETFGFTNLGEDTMDCSYPEYLDSKIHYFGNVLKTKICSDDECYKTKYSVKDDKDFNKEEFNKKVKEIHDETHKEVEFNSGKTKNNVIETIIETDYKNMEKYFKEIGYVNINSGRPKISNNISDQIVNIKRVDINFIGDKKDETIKYFDSVVMNYLEQILPSTLIINVNYCS